MSKTEEEFDGIDVARQYLEEKALTNAGGMPQGEHIALALYNLADVVGDRLETILDEEDEEE